MSRSRQPSGVDDGQGGDRGRLRAQDLGSERDGFPAAFRNCGALAAGPAALRTKQYRYAVLRAALRWDNGQYGRSRFLVEHKSMVRAGLQRREKGDRELNVRQASAAGLLASLPPDPLPAF